MYDKTDSIHTACLYGPASEIERCLRAGENINKHNENGLTPLHLAVQREGGNTEAIVELLLKNNADVNAQSIIEDDTALHLAIRYGQQGQVEDIAEKLVEYEADTQRRNRQLRKPYDYAIDKGLTELAELLAVDLPPKVALAKYKRKRQEYYGGRLIKAVIKGDMVDILHCIKRKAEVNFRNQHGAAAIHHTITHCPLHKAEVLDVLIDSGADVNLQDHEDDTALNLAIKSSTLRSNDVMYKLASKLLDLGTDYTLKDIDGKDAWAIAVERNYEDIKSLLRSRNASYPETPKPKPITNVQEEIDPDEKLFLAIVRGSLKDVQEALRLPGVNVNAKNKDGYYPVHLAVIREDTADKEAIIDLLHANKSNINALSEQDKKTPLHVAALTNDTISAQKLVDLKVALKVKDKGGLTPYALAVMLNHEEVAKIIKSRIPDPDIQDKWQKAAKKTKTCVIL